jgi:hypothetical protein
MRADTQTVTIEAPSKEVLSFVADGANLPRWAIGFAKAVTCVGDTWLVTTAQGQVATAIVVIEDAGTVDFHMDMGPPGTAVAFTRVVPNGDGAEFVFTQFQSGGMADEVFDQLVAAVRHELAALKALLEVECPV